ncbi:MaoC family dehydratase N-terminal domain-containing protein [Nocardia sp. CA2R105]|uniref:FAS1-like dehydratase domain-containing protein n=1 Tax=Nocardia coffeae TaxID=2873381 RepID=UPI001CA77F87|nr:MaoC family dehydratase N-terminal domain-containing protein [Nocardia coffeae]MBY8859417.1 MaoC family dehydratase N-terminal domain-containing protein [Nocardia coffeae]
MAEWEPHTVTTAETIDPGPVTALAALFDNGLPAPGPGDELPPMWHWVALPSWPVSTEIGSDGHPARGTFLPPVDLPRRMFAGGEVHWHSDIRIGETVRRISRVDSVTEKSGRSGRLVVVVVSIRLYRDGGELALTERQDLIYREAGTPSATEAPVADAAALTPVGSPFRRSDETDWEFTTDPTLLMRFSAATANAHRIHYDWPYATRVEGYPGLVVHGPLITLAAAEVRRLGAWPGRPVRLSHRNRAPLFCGQPAKLRARPDTRSVTVDLFGPEGESAGSHASVEISLR